MKTSKKDMQNPPSLAIATCIKVYFYTCIKQKTRDFACVFQHLAHIKIRFVSLLVLTILTNFSPHTYFIMFKFNYFKKYRIAGNTNSILRQFQLCMNFVMLGKENLG